LTPKFSVIIPVCHGGEFLDRTLASLACVEAPQGGFEVIIAGAKQTINDVVGESDMIGWQFLECCGNRSQSLNTACAVAQGKFWVFSDDDCVFPSGWLMNIERALTDFPDASVLGGSDVLVAEADDFDLALDVVLNSWVGTGGTRANRFFKAGRYYPKLWNMIVSADVAKRVAIDIGCIFDPSLPVHEDVDLIDRIEAQNVKVVYAPSVRVEHSRDTNFKAFFTRNMGMAAVCRQADIHRVSHLAMAIFFAGVALLGIASFFSPQITLVFLWVAGVYAMAAVLTGIHGAWEKKKFALLGIIPVLLFSLHLARVLGYVFAPFPPRKVIS
jgi:hypothetical protein